MVTVYYQSRVSALAYGLFVFITGHATCLSQSVELHGQQQQHTFCFEGPLQMTFFTKLPLLTVPFCVAQ